MGKSIESLVSFNAGEWSPTLTARVDQQKYRSACLQLRNMLCLKTGPATRRPGTQFISEGKTFTPPLDSAIRLEEFQFSIDTTFMLEFGQAYIRFYSNGAQVEVSTAPLWVTLSVYNPGDYVTSTVNGLIYFCIVQWIGGAVDPANDGGAHWVQQTILEVPTPYDARIGVGGIEETEVFQLQFCAINDVVYVCHPLHPRYKLVRITDEQWTFHPVKDMVPALLDQNATDVTIAADSITGSTVLTASAPPWSTAFYYEVGAAVTEVGVIYVCVTAHVSDVFATDLGLGYWEVQTIFRVGHVGSYWELANLRDSAYVEYTGDKTTGFAAGVSVTITAFGAWEVHTYGVWTADIFVQSSADGGVTWQTVRSVTGRSDRNVDVTGTAFKAQLYRIKVTNVAAPITPGATNPRVVFECVDAFLFGIVQISDFGIDVAANMVNGTVYQIHALGTINWGSLGASADFGLGTIFQYNGVAVTGTGGTVTTPYRARADVITQLPSAPAWVSLQGYGANQNVSYNGINYVSINPVTSATPPPSDATNWLADGYPTIYWSEGAWSDVRGYPRAITAFGQRVWCGFTTYEPQRVWGTQIDDIENWDLGDQTLATDGLAFDIDAVGDGAILWMQAQDALFVGLLSAEWVISSNDPTGAIGPTSVAAHRQSRWGSNKNIPAKVVGDALVFIQRQAFSMRQMLFSIVTSKYMSQDLTALSDQVLNRGGLQIAYQQQGQKNGFVWATTVDGELVGMTYELDQEIFGWHRHFTGQDAEDRFESVAVISGKGTDDDEVWVVVRRTVDGSVVRYVERINPTNWLNSTNAVKGAPGYPADKNQAYYVDAGLTYANPVSNVFTGLDHLEGRTVVVCINAINYGTFVVNLGQITVTDFTPEGVTTPTTYAHVGLPFTSTVQPMNLDVDVHTGVTQGIKKKVAGLFISFLNTLACKAWAGSVDANGVPIRVRELNFRPGNQLGGEPPLYSKVFEMDDFPGEIALNVPVILFTDGPLPLTVLGVAIDYNLTATP